MKIAEVFWSCTSYFGGFNRDRQQVVHQEILGDGRKGSDGSVGSGERIVGWAPS